jgi:CRP-like cAMP-binding protein
VFQQHFIFGNLAHAEHVMLLNQLGKEEVEKGHFICTEGEKGTSCYIISSGICAVLVKGQKVAELSAGQTFGELAMLYDVPRNASIVCASPKVSLFVISGVLYRRTMARARERTLNETVAFLNDHETFCNMTTMEKTMFASSLAPQSFKNGTKLNAECLYIVKSGSAEVVDQYKNRQVAGPGALISGVTMQSGVRAIDVTAISDLDCFAIGQKVIAKLFGNIGELMRCATVRNLLEHVGFYHELTDDQKTKVAGLFQEQRVRKGETIVTAQADPQLVIVIEGSISVAIPTAGNGGGKGFDSLVPASPDMNPELEIPHPNEVISGSAPPYHEMKELGRGKVFGEDTFTENGCMANWLVAKSDAVICRAGYDELCHTLRGKCDFTPPLTWIVQRNRVKDKLQNIFPFAPLHYDILDDVVEAFAKKVIAPNAILVSPTAALEGGTNKFWLVVEGEAVRRREGQPPEPLGAWSYFGTEQMMLGAPVDCEVTAAATGCTVLVLSRDKFKAVAGAVFGELETKTWYRSQRITIDSVFCIGLLGEGQFGVVRRVMVDDLKLKGGTSSRRASASSSRRAFSSEGYALKRINKKKAIQLDQQSPMRLAVAS